MDNHIKFEIEPVWFNGYGHESIIATLTGLEIHEIRAITEKLPNRWGGQLYRKVFNKLGFNTNHRFMPFDPFSPYPCIMRAGDKNIDSGWYAFPYNDRVFYNRGEAHALGACTKKIGGSYFITCFDKPLKITSMLQVWI